MQRSCITNHDAILAEQSGVFLCQPFSKFQEDSERQKCPRLSGFKVKAQSCILTWHREWPIDWT